MTDDPRPMSVYAAGLRLAERRRAEPLRDQDPVANAYAHGYFDAIDAMLAPLVGHAPGSCEEKLWTLVLELRAAAMKPVPNDLDDDRGEPFACTDCGENGFGVHPCPKSQEFDTSEDPA